MTDAPELNEDFADLLVAMIDAGVDFVVVGAHALAAHGVVRATGDLDVLVRPSAANATRVVAALRAFGAPLAAHGVDERDFAREGTVYQVGLPPRRIDVLTHISGVSFDEASGGRIEVETAGMTIPILGRAQLVRNKKASGRPKDLLDLSLLTETEPDQD